MDLIKDNLKHLNKNFKSDNVSDCVRVRFAPSPTGALHSGSIRSLLTNYIFAKKYGGKLILRIEDTDSTRYVDFAENYIFETCKWLGIEFDESPEKGGDFAPYRQSQRKDIYVEYVQQLIDSGHAYVAFDTKEELDAIRETDESFSYDAKTRTKFKNSLTIPEATIREMVKNGVPYVIRIKFPDEPVIITVNDMIRGEILLNTSTLDDKVIWKSVDYLPTYHLANVIDDHKMLITHILRGDEWITSAGLHVYLYQCFGWTPPKFAHLPLILKPEGNGKLSKRDGILGGFPVFPLSFKDTKEPYDIITGFREAGYLPSAVINFLAFLGWNPGTTKEVYTLEELIQDFSLERVNKSGARFNPEKAKWFNAQHLKLTPSSVLLEDFKNDLTEKGIIRSDDFLLKVLDSNKGKVSFIKDLYNEVSYLFKKPIEYDPKSLKRWTEKSPIIIDGLVKEFKNITNWVEKDIQVIFENFVNNSKLNFNEVAPQVRLLLTGKASSPSLFEIMEMLGKDETLDRLINYKF
jgi:glutamyl-tRNA synthetase